MSATRRLTTFTMLCALAILFHYVESLIVIPLPVPGFRLGLANIIALITLYLYAARAMLAVSLMRVLFVSLLQGTLFATSFWLSLSGVLLSCAAMSIARRCRCFSIYGVSVLGSVFHCIGQVIAVSWIYRQFFMQALLPLLCALGVLSGLLIGALAHQVLNRLQRERE